MQIASFLARGSTSSRRVITISMFGRRRSASRDYATSIATFGAPARADFALAGVKVGQARTGGEAGRLEMEQLRALLDRGRRHGTDRVGVDRPKTPASGNTAAVSHYKADNCPALAKTDLERGTPG